MKYFTYSHSSQAIDNSYSHTLIHILLFISSLSLLYALRVGRMRDERREDEVRDEIMKGERIRWEDERIRG